MGLSIVGSFASTKWAVARCQSSAPSGLGVGSGDGSGLSFGSVTSLLLYPGQSFQSSGLQSV